MNSRIPTCMAIVFAVALVVRLVTLVVLLPKLKPDVDRDYYRELGRNLAAGRGFIANDADSGRELPNIARTPVYPMFLAALMRLGGDRLGLFLAAQCVIGAVTCALTVLLAARWLVPRAALLAGFVVALDPSSVVRCSDLLTEILFTLLLVAGACVLVWQMECRWSWFCGGVIWGVAALCRPLAVWLWAVAAVVLILQRWNWSRRALLFGVFLAGFLPLLGIWAERNHALTGHWFVSTIAESNLFHYRAAGIEAAKRGEDFDVFSARWRAQYGDVLFFEGREIFETRLKFLKRSAMETIRSAPLIAIQQNNAGWARTLLGPGQRGMYNILARPEPMKWWPVYSVALLALNAFAAAGAWRLRREAVLAVAIVIYFFLLSGGPGGSARLRLPITPFLAVLAVEGARCFKRTP